MRIKYDDRFYGCCKCQKQHFVNDPEYTEHLWAQSKHGIQYLTDYPGGGLTAIKLGDEGRVPMELIVEAWDTERT